MSECLLFLMNAPRIKTREGASAFVTRWQDKTASATDASITAFLREMDAIWPDNGDTSLWYEGAPREPVTKPVLQLALDLERVDRSVIEQLHKLASTHRLHIFDPEGDVLYRADGSEESSDALRISVAPPVMPTEVQRSPDGLRFDGVYASVPKAGDTPTLLRLTEDGKAYWGNSGGATPSVGFLALHEGSIWVACGKYTVKQGCIFARVRAGWGSFRLSADMAGESLRLTSVRSDGQKLFTAIYHFCAAR